MDKSKKMAGPAGRSELTLLADLQNLQQRLGSEYDLFYELQKMPAEKLKEEMKDSDFDRMQNGTHTETECIALYRAKCRGRMTVAGNVSGELRALIALHS